MKLSELQEIGEEQKEALDARDSGFPRAFLAVLPDIQSHALILSGIRRCGKSTLLHQFVKKLKKPFFYCNFDDIRLTGFSTADYSLLDRVIAETGARLLFFDEIQTAERWELYVRQKLDEGFQVITTGSNASLLSRELGTKLTGRHLSKELFPFSYPEYCGFSGQTPGAESLDRYLEKGGFPEYLKTGNPDILTQLQKDILYRDIAVRYGIRDASSLHQLYIYLASNPAQLVSPSRLLSVAGVKSATTVLEYFSHFEDAYLIHSVPCFAWSAKARTLAPKKVYIADSGIVKTASTAFSGNQGALLENFVFNSLRLHTDDIYYFSGKTGECDFIVNPHEAAHDSAPKSVRAQKPTTRKRSGAARHRPQCIQVTRELTPDNETREIQGLLSALEFFGRDEGFILTRNTEDLILTQGKTIHVVPAWKWEFCC
jgi:predicted AAA+ superfamily ATPase